MMRMRYTRYTIAALATVSITGVNAQSLLDRTVTKTQVERIENTLAADDMMGRMPGTPAMDKAAAFIANEFRSAALKTVKGADNYLQEFSIPTVKPVTLNATIDGREAAPGSVVVISPQSSVQVSETSGYEQVILHSAADLSSALPRLMLPGKNYLVVLDTSMAAATSRLSRMRRGLTTASGNIVFLVSDHVPARFSVTATQEVSNRKLMNVVGMIPGKTRPDEFVIFSGHYDHLGISKDHAPGADSIFNGANDDAAGTTAVIMLSKYFRALGNNDRTIVFAAFTAEESGGFGAQYFSRQFDPVKVMAMFNIEMIGTQSKWGRNSAYITGYEKTDMGSILQKNLTGTGFTFYPDPYTTQNLFYRSDNATLARLGVPAHTISTSKMDNEPNYHKVSDEVSTLDLDNMVEIIKAVALSSTSIIQGKDTPSRVNTAELR